MASCIPTILKTYIDETNDDIFKLKKKASVEMSFRTSRSAFPGLSSLNLA